MKITILVDNQAKPGLAAEHGLSFLIETAETTILFDTGQGTAFQANADKLGIRPETASVLVLSHGHYDHTGNVLDVLERNPKIPVYAHSLAVLRRYSLHADGTLKDVSMPRECRRALTSHLSGRFVRSDIPTRIAPGIGVTGRVPRRHPFEDTGGNFYLDYELGLTDPVDDDQSLWFETPEGVVVVTGCCHCGLLNLLDFIRETTGIPRIHAIVGGLHLHSASKERLGATVRTLRNLDVRRIHPCHCTGDSAVEVLQDQLGDSVMPVRAGDILEF
jgi:7,8-dihydropterin-6-yl-methyl-4-(beta-D-ribofuranosyl)aminobenzene 5'-phosphate synthase